MSGFSYAAGQIPRTQTNDAAAAGRVGELITASIASPGVTLANATPKTVISQVFQPGDYEICGEVAFLCDANTSVLYQRAGLSLVTDQQDLTLGNYATQSFGPGVVLGAGVDNAVLTPPVRFSFAVATPVFLFALSSFTVGGVKAYGIIRGRPMR